MFYLVHVIGYLCQPLFHLLHVPPLFLKLKTKLCVDMGTFEQQYPQVVVLHEDINDSVVILRAK